MEESEIDEYNLNSNERQQSLKLSLINNQQISIILTNKDNQQIYTTQLSLIQLKKISEAFNSSNNIKEALDLLKNTIESENILLIEDPKEPSLIEIKFNISLSTKEYPPFDIKLFLENNALEKKKNVMILKNYQPLLIIWEIKIQKKDIFLMVLQKVLPFPLEYKILMEKSLILLMNNFNQLENKWIEILL